MDVVGGQIDWARSLLDPFNNTITEQIDFFEDQSNTLAYNVPSTESNSVVLLDHFRFGGQKFMNQSLPAIADSLTYANLHEADEVTVTRQAATVWPINGAVLAERPFVVVRWAWIALPITLNVIGACFLMITMLHTRQLGIQLWKPSAMEML